MAIGEVSASACPCRRILTTVCDDFGSLPGMALERIGMGAGTRDGKHRPNVLRVLLGTSSEATDPSAVVLEANLDDAPGEWVGHCLARQFDAGARHGWCVPIYRKKNRPGVILTVLCDPADVPACEAVLFAETSTFGVRRRVVQRTVLERRFETVKTPFGPIRMKIGIREGQEVQAAPEYEDCAAAANQHDQPLRVVMEAARRAWQDAHAP